MMTSQKQKRRFGRTRKHQKMNMWKRPVYQNSNHVRFVKRVLTSLNNVKGSRMPNTIKNGVGGRNLEYVSVLF
jgi:hypothetical protein